MEDRREVLERSQRRGRSKVLERWWLKWEWDLITNFSYKYTCFQFNNIIIKCSFHFYHFYSDDRFSRLLQSPFHIGTYSPSSGSIFKPQMILTCTTLNGTRFSEISFRKTFDTGSNCTHPSRCDFWYKVKLYSPKPQTIGSDITCWVIRGGKTGKISQEWELSQTHTREWHHLQPKTLRDWVCGFSFLYVAQLSYSYSMWDLDSHLDT